MTDKLLRLFILLLYYKSRQKCHQFIRQSIKVGYILDAREWCAGARAQRVPRGAQAPLYVSPLSLLTYVLLKRYRKQQAFGLSREIWFFNWNFLELTLGAIIALFFSVLIMICFFIAAVKCFPIVLPVCSVILCFFKF